MARFDQRPIQVGYAQYARCEDARNMRGKHAIFLVSPDTALHGLRRAGVVFADAFGLRRAITPVGGNEKKAPNARLSRRFKRFCNEREVVLELPKRHPYQVDSRARAGAGFGDAPFVLGIPLEVFAERIAMEAHLQTQVRPSDYPVWNCPRAQQGSQRPAYRTVRAEKNYLTGNAHTLLRYRPLRLAASAGLYPVQGPPMFLRKLRVMRVVSGGETAPVPIAWLDSFAMRNFTNDAAFDDTLPVEDGLLEAGLRVPLPELRTAMEAWFRRKGWLATSEWVEVREELHPTHRQAGERAGR